MNKKYTKETLEPVILKSTSFRQVILEFGLKENGGNYSQMRKRCDKFNIDYSHFNGQGWRKIGHPSFTKNSTPLEEFFVYDKKKKSSDKVKKRLLSNGLKEYKCERCDLTDWMKAYIVLELHHKNGDTLDNRLYNLELLCPNCHSQTHTYCKRKELL